MSRPTTASRRPRRESRDSGRRLPELDRAQRRCGGRRGAPSIRRHRRAHRPGDRRRPVMGASVPPAGARLRPPPPSPLPPRVPSRLVRADDATVREFVARSGNLESPVVQGLTSTASRLFVSRSPESVSPLGFDHPTPRRSRPDGGSRKSHAHGKLAGAGSAVGEHGASPRVSRETCRVVTSPGSRVLPADQGGRVGSSVFHVKHIHTLPR